MLKNGIRIIVRTLDMFKCTFEFYFLHLVCMDGTQKDYYGYSKQLFNESLEYLTPRRLDGHTSRIIRYVLNSLNENLEHLALQRLSYRPSGVSTHAEIIKCRYGALSQ